jgi:hypothetical protein
MDSLTRKEVPLDCDASAFELGAATVRVETPEINFHRIHRHRLRAVRLEQQDGRPALSWAREFVRDGARSWGEKRAPHCEPAKLVSVREGQGKFEDGLADWNVQDELVGFFVALEPHGAGGVSTRGYGTFAKGSVVDLTDCAEVHVMLGGVELRRLRGNEVVRRLRAGERRLIAHVKGRGGTHASG